MLRKVHYKIWRRLSDLLEELVIRITPTGAFLLERAKEMGELRPEDIRIFGASGFAVGSVEEAKIAVGCLHEFRPENEVTKEE